MFTEDPSHWYFELFSSEDTSQRYLNKLHRDILNMSLQSFIEQPKRLLVIVQRNFFNLIEFLFNWCFLDNIDPN